MVVVTREGARGCAAAWVAGGAVFTGSIGCDVTGVMPTPGAGMGEAESSCVLSRAASVASAGGSFFSQTAMLRSALASASSLSAA